MRQVAFDDSLQSRAGIRTSSTFSKGLTECVDRLVKYYSPTLYSLMGGILSLFVNPRETPLADNLVLSASAKTDPEHFTLMSRMQEKAHGMEQLDMAAECLDHMAAGIDTTGGMTNYSRMP